MPIVLDLGLPVLIYQLQPYSGPDSAVTSVSGSDASVSGYFGSADGSRVLTTTSGPELLARLASGLSPDPSGSETDEPIKERGLVALILPVPDRPIVFSEPIATSSVDSSHCRLTSDRSSPGPAQTGL